MNDLPPKGFGYRHLSLAPLYGYNGYLYFIPESEREYTKFDVEECDDDIPPEYPKGGHNYYNNRDMALMIRRFCILTQSRMEEEGWQERYEKAVQYAAAKNAPKATNAVEDSKSSLKPS